MQFFKNKNDIQCNFTFFTGIWTQWSLGICNDSDLIVWTQAIQTALWLPYLKWQKLQIPHLKCECKVSVWWQGQLMHICVFMQVSKLYSSVLSWVFEHKRFLSKRYNTCTYIGIPQYCECTCLIIPFSFTVSLSSQLKICKSWAWKQQGFLQILLGLEFWNAIIHFFFKYLKFLQFENFKTAYKLLIWHSFIHVHWYLKVPHATYLENK